MEKVYQDNQKKKRLHYQNTFAKSFALRKEQNKNSKGDVREGHGAVSEEV